jgi:hypothetical protein
MTILICCFIFYVAISSTIIWKLYKEIKVYRDTWIQIEEITDHNKDGDIVIHAHKVD